MLGYLRNALCKCRLNGNKSVDWDATWASFGLLLLTVGIIAGDTITKFFLGGRQLVVAGAAQANPHAVFYPEFNTLTDNTNEISDATFGALRSLRSEAVYQASARKTNDLGVRIQLHSKYLADGAPLPDGTSQNGTWVQFVYQYSLSGFEMGLRDAPELEIKFRGSCATYNGMDGISYDSSGSPDQTSGSFEDWETYLYPGDTTGD